MFRKKILVLCGSQKDLDKNGEPNALADLLKESVHQWNEEHPTAQLDLILKVCSADRTPFLLTPMINEQKVDGIIYIGGYSLVLGASLQEALLTLCANDHIENPTRELIAFMEKTTGDRKYFPGSFAPTLITHERSNYYKSTEYIPTVAVPCPDLPSQGQSAFTTVVESPSGSEPRPAVGLKRADVAINYMGNLFQQKQNSPLSILLVYEEGNGDAKEGVQSINRRLDSFGYSSKKVMNLSSYLEYIEDQEDSQLVCFVAGADDKGLKQLQVMDQSTDLVLFCPVKQTMQALWPAYLSLSSQLDSTIHIGVGNYDNAAILLTQLLGDKKLQEGMWRYRNEKTQESILDLSSWIYSFNEVCV